MSDTLIFSFGYTTELKIIFRPKSQFELKIIFRPKSQFELKIIFRPKSQFELKIIFRPKSQFELNIIFRPKFQFELKIIFRPKSQFQLKIIFRPKSEFELKIIFRPKSQFELEMDQQIQQPNRENFKQSKATPRIKPITTGRNLKAFSEIVIFPVFVKPGDMPAEFARKLHCLAKKSDENVEAILRTKSENLKIIQDNIIFFKQFEKRSSKKLLKR